MADHGTIDHTGITGVGGINSGTSFPGTPATDDLFYRTDRDLLYFYDGTRWLTVTLYRESFAGPEALNPITATATMGRFTPWHSTYDMWLDKLYATTYVSTTNDGSNFWSIDLIKATGPNVPTTIVNFTTAADAAANYVSREVSIGALLGTTHKTIILSVSKSGAPGGVYIATAIAYRLVG